VLGIDDWAWRRGHRYGTVLVDLERNEVVDLLPNRDAATVAAWLRDHPGVEIVARDRAGVYADGVRQGAPGVMQVADRWHLLRNLGDAVQALTDRFSIAAGRAAADVKTHLLATTAANPSVTSSVEPSPTAAQRRSEASRQCRQARFEEAARMHSLGFSISRIAAEPGKDRETVRSWLRLGRPPSWSKPACESMLCPCIGYLERRWNEGCHNGARLWRELREFGFKGRPSVVKQWAAGRRRYSKANGSFDEPLAWPTPKGFRLARLLMSEMSILGAEERLFVTRLLDEEAGLAAAIAWAKRLNAMLRRKAVEDLDKVLTVGAATMRGRFALGLRRDFDAIAAALETPWTTSPVEGQISRLKTLKRTMYGRAGFEVLRARVLQAA
jgi:transposase